jgi:hypothetical protein
VLAYIIFIHNWSENVKIGTCNRGLVMNLAAGIDPSAYREIGTRKYWVNNNLVIWNWLATKTKLDKLKFQIEITKNEIKMVTFYCLSYMKIKINIEETFINMRDISILEYPIVETYLESVLELFLQFDKEYLIISLELMAIYGIMQEIDEFINFRKNQRNLVEDEKSWIFKQKNPVRF